MAEGEIQAPEHRVLLMPELLQEIAELVGEENAVRFAENFGGRRVYFPNRPKPNDPVAGIIGHRNMQALCRRFSPHRMRIPSARPYLHWYHARRLKLEGWENRDIAGEMKIDERYVARLVKGLDLTGVVPREKKIEPDRCPSCGHRRHPPRRAAIATELPCQLDLPV